MRKPVSPVGVIGRPGRQLCTSTLLNVCSSRGPRSSTRCAQAIRAQPNSLGKYHSASRKRYTSKPIRSSHLRGKVRGQNAGGVAADNFPATYWSSFTLPLTPTGSQKYSWETTKPAQSSKIHEDCPRSNDECATRRLQFPRRNSHPARRGVCGCCRWPMPRKSRRPRSKG